MWSAWQPDRNLYFNSFFVRHPEGNLAIDPLPLAEADAAEIEAAGGLAWIAITNRDHERDARALAARFGARSAAGALDAPLLGGRVDRTLRDGDLLCGARIVCLDGFKTPGEFALHFPQTSTVVVGDALWGAPAGALTLMADAKLADPPRAVLSLRRLRALLPQHLLTGDGACIFGDAHRVLWRTLEARPDAYVNRINRDEVPWNVCPADPPGFAGRTLEIDGYIGAEKLGYRVLQLPPGNASCPSHWHAEEEELFVVLSGTASLQTPRGAVPLRAGDFVAFPTRAEGTHKVVNDGTESCEILMVSNYEPADVCYYPDSRKVLVERSDLMLRDHPALDYWDFE
jgi:uncharacterized cupin superfamily protein/glyoxylase-like metal-dependent hydrolase (beta-lactamase superfamily II)